MGDFLSRVAGSAEVIQLLNKLGNILPCIMFAREVPDRFFNDGSRDHRRRAKIAPGGATQCATTMAAASCLANLR